MLKRYVRHILKEIDIEKQMVRANSVDPDEMAHEPSHLHLHCLPGPFVRSVV